MILIENSPSPQVFYVNTDFNIKINPSLKTIIEQIEGVEELDTFGVHKYNFRVCFGKAFCREEIQKQVEKKIADFVCVVDGKKEILTHERAIKERKKGYSKEELLYWGRKIFKIKPNEGIHKK